MQTKTENKKESGKSKNKIWKKKNGFAEMRSRIEPALYSLR